MGIHDARGLDLEAEKIGCAWKNYCMRWDNHIFMIWAHFYAKYNQVFNLKIKINYPFNLYSFKIYFF